MTQVSAPDAKASGLYYGLAGHIIQAIEPHSEADPVGILVQLLVGIGNIVGRNAFFEIEATKHFPNLFAVLVGSSSSARKGTSWNHCLRVLSAVDPAWADKRVQAGLSSGEGLIAALKDVPSVGTDDDKPVATDKRLMVVETEFSSTLTVFERSGNILSPLLRQAWDSGTIRVMTKNPQHATGVHVSVIGHITPQELSRRLTTTDAANGFANRFMWLSVSRSKFLPDGGDVVVLAEKMASFRDELRPVIEFARSAGDMKRNPEATELWHELYTELTRDIPGLFGSVVARGAPIVVRLSMIYALLDRSSIIRVEHLAAANALWKYSEKSARAVFGERLGDPVADKILDALRQSHDGLTRSQIRELFARNQNSDRITNALELLASHSPKLAYCEQRETGGRPAEIWYAT